MMARILLATSIFLFCTSINLSFSCVIESCQEPSACRRRTRDGRGFSTDSNPAVAGCDSVNELLFRETEGEAFGLSLCWLI